MIVIYVRDINYDVILLIIIIYCSFLIRFEHLYSALSGKGFKGTRSILNY